MTTWRRLYCESSRDSQSASHLRKHHAIISQLSATSIFGTAYRRNHSQFNYATSLLTERDIRYIAQTRTVLQDGNTPLRPPTIHLLQVRPPSYIWSKLVQIILDTHPYLTFCIQSTAGSRLELLTSAASHNIRALMRHHMKLLHSCPHNSARVRPPLRK